MSAAVTPTERPGDERAGDERAGDERAGDERAGDERARAREFDRLLGRWRELREQGRGPAVPDCFCGSLDDLRRLVADLEARQQHEHRDHEHHNELEREIEDEEIEP